MSDPETLPVLSKDDLAMVNAMGAGLHGAARDDFILGVRERLRNAPDLTKNQIRAAATAELGKGK
jgi:hypothetical protein